MLRSRDSYSGTASESAMTDVSLEDMTYPSRSGAKDLSEIPRWWSGESCFKRGEMAVPQKHFAVNKCYIPLLFG